MSDPIRFTASAEQAGLRLDRFLAEALGVSRRRAAEVIADGRVSIEGRAARKGLTVSAGTVVEVFGAPPSADSPAVPDDSVPVALLHEDPRVVAVSKPAGVHCHPLADGERGTVANFLAARYPEMQSVGFSAREPGLVHRIDRDTSGLILAARDAEAFANLRAQFESHAVKKTYLAVVEGRPPRKGRIDRPIAKSGRRGPRVEVVDVGSPSGLRDVRPAETRFRVKEPLRNAALIQVEPVTGLMHQIRAHMAHIGHPLVGDRLYGWSGGDAPRHLLHAWKIAFAHPTTGAKTEIVCPLAEDFRAMLERFRD